MRRFFIMLAMAILPLLPVRAAVSINIGINVPAYPTLQRIPGYPVYYAPRLHANYFFYDGLYWVYVPDGWYVSPWYDGPWDFVPIDSVPLFILRIPVRYYGYPPVIFREWVTNAPPRWDTLWGPDWARRHPRWQHWNRAATPAPAPLPRYQERFTRTNYPDEAQRRELTQQHYRYTPHDKQVRQHWQAQVGGAAVQPQARSGPRHEPQVPRVRTQEYEARAHGRQQGEQNDAPVFRQEPPRRAPPAPPEPQRMRVEAPRPGSFGGHGRVEERESAHAPRPEHGGRADKPRKENNDGGHERGKHH